MIRAALLFGGRSAEHEVSILSARSVAAAAPAGRVEIVPIFVTKEGKFVVPEKSAGVLAGGGAGAPLSDVAHEPSRNDWRIEGCVVRRFVVIERNAGMLDPGVRFKPLAAAGAAPLPLAERP